MADKTYNLLFLCTGNSARSILGEAIVNQLGARRFKGFSAGSRPKGAVHPYAIDLLTRLGHPTDDLRSKSWEEFAKRGAPSLDFVFTVCDSAAAESCPIWPGQPMTGHWSIADPAAVEGSETERRAAFADAYNQLHDRISQFLDLPHASLDRMALKRKLGQIGNG